MFSNYIKELSEMGHIVEVRDGENIDLDTYVAAPNSPDEFLVNESLSSIINYLNLPMIRDDFEVHEERVKWFSETGIFTKYGSDFYFKNKLRINMTSGPLRWIRHLTDDSFKRRFPDPNFFLAIESEINTFESNYQIHEKSSLVENLQYVEAFVLLLKKVLNEMIDHALVEGTKV